MTSLLNCWRRIASLLFLAAALSACATGPRLVAHAFTFDGWNDGWANTIDLLEFQYGDQYKMVQRVSRDGSGLGYRFGVNGEMPIGDFLKVKWRIKQSGQVIEDRVDLRGRLPNDMQGQTVTFLIEGLQLYVFLVTPVEIKKRLSDRPKRTWHSRYNLSYEVYPSNELNP